MHQWNLTEVRCFTCETQWCYRMEKGHVREQNGCQLSEQGWNAWVTEKKKAMCSISKALICGVRYNFEEAKWDSNPKPHDCILHKTCRYRMWVCNTPDADVYRHAVCSLSQCNQGTFAYKPCFTCLMYNDTVHASLSFKARSNVQGPA